MTQQKQTTQEQNGINYKTERHTKSKPKRKRKSKETVNYVRTAHKCVHITVAVHNCYTQCSIEQ